MKSMCYFHCTPCIEVHPCEVFSFWQVLDDGRVTDSQGRTVSFKNTIIIMTSNLGSHVILEGVASNPEAVKETVMQLVWQCHTTRFSCLSLWKPCDAVL